MLAIPSSVDLFSPTRIAGLRDITARPARHPDGSREIHVLRIPEGISEIQKLAIAGYVLKLYGK
jgi:hypothetical protein